MKLRYYILRRLLLLIPVLIGISLVTFVLTHDIPNYDPASPWLKPKYTQAERDQVIKLHNLDKPVLVQYLSYLNDLAHLDLGLSTSEGERPVAEALRDYLPATVELTLSATLLCVIIGVPLGIVSALKKDGWPDHLIRIFNLASVSIPVFWLALVLQLVFYAWLKVLPLGDRLPTGTIAPTFTLPFVSGLPILGDFHSTGLYTVDSLLSGNLGLFWQVVLHLILPSFCLAFIQLSVISRLIRSSLLEALAQDYVRTARSKGLPERIVVLKHALRNALAPTMTATGMLVGGMLSGAVLTETIFSWPGIGRYSTTAIVELDYPALIGFILIVATVFVITNLLVDVLYAYLDPRIRYG